MKRETIIAFVCIGGLAIVVLFNLIYFWAYTNPNVTKLTNDVLANKESTDPKIAKLTNDVLANKASTDLDKTALANFIATVDPKIAKLTNDVLANKASTDLDKTALANFIATVDPKIAKLTKDTNDILANQESTKLDKLDYISIGDLTASNLATVGRVLILKTQDANIEPGDLLYRKDPHNGLVVTNLPNKAAKSWFIGVAVTKIRPATGSVEVAVHSPSGTYTFIKVAGTLEGTGSIRLYAGEGENFSKCTPQQPEDGQLVAYSRGTVADGKVYALLAPHVNLGYYKPA